MSRESDSRESCSLEKDVAPIIFHYVDIFNLGAVPDIPLTPAPSSETSGQAPSPQQHQPGQDHEQQQEVQPQEQSSDVPPTDTPSISVETFDESGPDPNRFGFKFLTLGQLVRLQNQNPVVGTSVLLFKDLFLKSFLHG